MLLTLLSKHMRFFSSRKCLILVLPWYQAVLLHQSVHTGSCMIHCWCHVRSCLSMTQMVRQWQLMAEASFCDMLWKWLVLHFTRISFCQSTAVNNWPELFQDCCGFYISGSGSLLRSNFLSQKSFGEHGSASCLYFMDITFDVLKNPQFFPFRVFLVSYMKFNQ